MREKAIVIVRHLHIIVQPPRLLPVVPPEPFARAPIETRAASTKTSVTPRLCFAEHSGRSFSRKPDGNGGEAHTKIPTGFDAACNREALIIKHRTRPETSQPLLH